MITKEIKAAIEREIEARWKARCDSAAGMGYGRPYGLPRERFTLYNAGIRFGEYDVTQNGTKIAKVHRRYAQRKVNGYYRELKPTIEWT